MTTVLTMLGLVMVLSATSISQFHQGNSPWRLFNRQLLWAVLGFIGLWFAMRIPTRRWRRLVAARGSAICSSLMVLPFVPGIGDSVNDANAWVAIGPLNFQPSEFLKLAVLLAAADLLARRQDGDARPATHDVAVGARARRLPALCLVQGDLGSAIVLAAIVFAVAFIAGAPLPLMTAAGGMGAVGALAFVASSPRRSGPVHRVHGHRGPQGPSQLPDVPGDDRIAQGGLTGSGIGRGDNKLGSTCRSRTATSSSPSSPTSWA